MSHLSMPADIDMRDSEESEAFEALLAAISARFSNLPSDHIDNEIEESQRMVCEHLGIDVCALWQQEQGSLTTLLLTHYYRTPEGPDELPRLNVAERFPWSLRQILTDKTIIAGSIDQLPPEAERDAASWRQLGIKTVLAFPLATGGELLSGAIFFHDVRAERTWSPTLVTRLYLVFRIFASALNQRHLQHRLKDGERHMALTHEALCEDQWILDVNTCRFRVGKKIMELFAVEPETDLSMDSFIMRVHEEDRAMVRDAVKHVIESRNSSVVKYRMIGRDGQVRWLQAVGRLTGGAGGEPLRVIGTTIDITSRKMWEDAVRYGEDKHAMVINSDDLGFYETGEDGVLLSADDKLRVLMGAGPEEAAQGRSFWLSRIHAADYSRVLKAVVDVIENGVEQFAMEYRYMHPVRGVIWLHHISRVLKKDAQGRAARSCGVIQDITERKLSEESLKESRTHLHAIMNSTSDFVWSVDGENFGFLAWNESFGSYCSTNLGRVLELGMSPEEAFPPEYARLWRGMYERTLKQGSYTTEYMVSRKTHHLLLSLNTIMRAGRVCGISVFGKDITSLKKSEEALKDALGEVERLREQLKNENIYLREQVLMETACETVDGESKAIREVMKLAKRVASVDSIVLITGETGTGKEVLAQAIHEMSSRGSRAIIKVNCAALPPPLVESELFGREKGAYTGAMKQQVGRFEMADGSTLFLDEIGDLPLDLQAKLLRVLQDGQFERLGSSRTIKTNVRVIAATNRDLESMVREGKFREDLYHRLNVFPIKMPPLRERVEDIPLLTWKFVQEFNVQMGRSVVTIPRQTMEQLKQYSWPGNVRELRHLVERAMIVSDGRSLVLSVPTTATAVLPETSPATLEDVERKHILSVLEQTRWRIRGARGAAEILGIPPTTLHSRMKKLGIVRRR